MKRTYILAAFLIFLTAANIYPSDSINTKYGTFYDDIRKREVPYKIYYNDNLTGESPVVIFSHGLGGSVEAAEYLGEHLAKNGYICFHIQHHGSDESVWKGAKTKREVMKKLKESIKDYRNALNRFKDIPFVIDEIIKLNKTSDIFKGHLDTNNIAMAGHSYGARSVMIASGERVGKLKLSFKETRIKVSIALSPSFPDNPPDDLNDIYKDIDIPIFHITGSEDGDPLDRKGDFSPTDRTKPYYNIKTSTQYLLVLDKAVHGTFNGNGKMSTDDPYFTKHLEDVKKGVTAFLNYYLKRSEPDGKWLKNDFVKTLDAKDKFEWKELR